MLSSSFANKDARTGTLKFELVVLSVFSSLFALVLLEVIDSPLHYVLSLAKSATHKSELMCSASEIMALSTILACRDSDRIISGRIKSVENA